MRAGPAGVGDRGELVGGEVGGRPVRAGQYERPCSIATTCSTATPSIGLDVAERTAVDPHGRAVGQHDVARRSGRDRVRTGRDGKVEADPGRVVTITQIDRVRPDEVMEFVELEAEPVPRSNGASLVADDGGCSKSASSSTIRRRRSHAAFRRRAQASVGSRSVAGVIRRRSAACHGGGTGPPGNTRAWRPSASGPAWAAATPRGNAAGAATVRRGCTGARFGWGGIPPARAPRCRSPRRRVRRRRRVVRRRANTAGSARASRVRPRSTHTRSPSL